MSMTEPLWLFTFTPEMFTVFCATLPAVMSRPVGSIHVTPFTLIPKGITSGAPSSGLIAETDVMLPGASVMFSDFAKASPVIGFTGPVPSPFQPRLMLPSGTRSAPPCTMRDA